jgi:integrase
MIGIYIMGSDINILSISRPQERAPRMKHKASVEATDELGETGEKQPEKKKRKPRREQNRMLFTELDLKRLNVKKLLEMANRERLARGKKAVGQVQIWDKAQKGLSLLVSAGGTKTFRSMFLLNGSWQSRTIGRFGEVVVEDGFEENANIAWARERVRKDRALAKQGTDPREQQPQPGAKTTYEAVVDQFIELYAKPRQRTWEQTRDVLKRNCKPWLKKQFGSITKKHAYDLLDGFIADERPYKAAVTLAWLKTLWRWAFRRDLVASPVMDAVEIHFERKERDRVYSEDEIKAIWKAAGKISAVEGAYVKLLVLLAPRKSALAGIRVGDLDDAKNPTLWTTPHELTKSKKMAKRKRVYLTPLPPLAQRIIKALLPGANAATDLIFPGAHKGLPIWPGSPLQKKLVEAGAPADFAFHTVRHTLATWLENQGHDNFDRALVLNHASGGVTSGYSHGYAIDRKRDLLTKWADHVEGLVAPKGAELLR